jgi:hypothetical protein
MFYASVLGIQLQQQPSWQSLDHQSLIQPSPFAPELLGDMRHCSPCVSSVLLLGPFELP